MKLITTLQRPPLSRPRGSPEGCTSPCSVCSSSLASQRGQVRPRRTSKSHITRRPRESWSGGNLTNWCWDSCAWVLRWLVNVFLPRLLKVMAERALCPPGSDRSSHLASQSGRVRLNWDGAVWASCSCMSCIPHRDCSRDLRMLRGVCRHM